jgi:hypothetical protein
MSELIVDFIKQIPGDFESPRAMYKGKKYRTVFFLEDFEIAQFYEVDNKLVRDWKMGDSFTSSAGTEYASMNLSLTPRSFIAVYHDQDTVSLEEAKSALIEEINQ